MWQVKLAHQQLTASHEQDSPLHDGNLVAGAAI